MIIIIIKIIKLWTSLLMEWDMENNTNVIQRKCFPLVDLFSSHAYECSVLEDCGLSEQSKYKWNVLCLLEETLNMNIAVTWCTLLVLLCYILY